MSRHSIGLRLTVWYSAILFLALALFSLTIWLALDFFLQRNFETSLRSQGQGLRQYLLLEDQDPAVNLALELDEYSQTIGHEYLLQVLKEAGQPLFTNDAWMHFEAAGATSSSATIVHGSVRLREGLLRYSVGRSSADVHRTLDLLAVLLCGAIPLLLAGAGLGGYVVSRRALAPVEAITQRARAIGVDTLSERLPVSKAQDELHRLTIAWNEMLGRLEAAVRNISDFTANASHELRTPVTIIRLAAENGLRRKRSDMEYEQTLKQIQSTTEGMTSLIGDLLFLARADAMTSPILMAEKVSLLTVVESACSDLDWMAAEKGIAVTQSILPDNLEVRGDAAALRRLLTILLENALKYTPAGGRVGVQAAYSENQVVLQVADSGIGIPDALRSRVFERFFRVDESRDRASGGNGLGLSIAHTIVKQHKGAIVLTPNAGGGCVFSVYLH